MDIIVKISEFIIPVIVFAVLLHGIVKKRPVYEDFTEGAKEGISTSLDILPSLICLMTCIGILYKVSSIITSKLTSPDSFAMTSEAST